MKSENDIKNCTTDGIPNEILRKCEGCIWYYNEFCTCDGLKPCDFEKEVANNETN